MTCVVAVRGKDKNVVLAGERGASDETTIINLNEPKIFKTGKFLIGFAGSMAGDKLRYRFKPSDPRQNVSLDQHMNTTFLQELQECYEDSFVPHLSPDSDLSLIIVVNGQIYQHHAGDMSMTKPAENYIAIGSGAEYAYGSFWSTEQIISAQTRAELAVGSAVKFSPTCTGKVDVLIG